MSFGFTLKDQSPQHAAHRSISYEVSLSRSIIRDMYRTYHNSRPDSPTHPMITLAIDEHDGRTYAKVELHMHGARLYGLGVAYRHPADCLARDTGEELATARAFSNLAERLSALCRTDS